jgi:dimethylargininase
MRRALSSHPERDRIDPVRAAGQHARFVAALITTGVDVHLLPADPELPDACFTWDAVLAFAQPSVGDADAEASGGMVGDGTVLLVACRPGEPARRNEVAPVFACARKVIGHKVDAMAIEPPGTLDGGDVITFGDRVAIGVSARTNEAGARQLAGAVQRLGYRAFLCPVSGRLHLASAITPIGPARLVGTAGGFASLDAAGEQVAPRDQVGRIVLADDDVVAANVLSVEGRCFVASGHSRAVGLMRAAGEDVVEVELDEFIRADGGPTCLVALIP